MRRLLSVAAKGLAALLAGAALALLVTAGADAAAQTGWPRTFTVHGGTVVVYQPQVKDWPNYTVLSALAAVAITPSGSTAPIYGIVKFSALTSADFSAGTVSLAQLRINSTRFPNEPAAVSAKMGALVREVPLENTTVPLATVLTSLDGAKALPKNVALSNAPPKIFFSQKPAILLVFDRDPILAPIEGTNLKFAVNTNWTVIRDDAAGLYYLLATDHWLSAPSIDGPWSPAAAPSSFAAIPNDANWSDLHKYLYAAPLAPGAVPMVYASTSAADLIYVSGAPSLVKIPGTQLQYVANTGSNLFLYAPSKQWFVLLSGRWYQAPSLAGPWAYATPTLPADFTKIPLNSARGGVLVSVPGTPEAQYAGASMAAPQIATVNPANAKVTVVYSGTPDFQPISGTALSYAVNTPNDVIEVNDGLYYVCYSGIWFSSTSPSGPWAVAAYVPQSIYTIPPSSPLYQDTYVYVYNTFGVPVYAPPVAYNPAAAVFAGFTAGYMCGYWSNNAWMYGTGFYYPGFYVAGAFPVYYPYAATWTGGAVYTGGSYYNARTGYYGNQASVYGPYGGATARSAYNPATGTYARGAAVYGPNGGAAAGSFYNPRYGVSGSTFQAKTPYGSWGASAVSTRNGTTYAAHASNANGSGAIVSGPHGSTSAYKSANGDLYAGHDGNVYRSNDGSWQKSTGGNNWSNVSTPSSQHSSGEGSLDRDFGARQAGSGGFGGFRGGGGRR